MADYGDTSGGNSDQAIRDIVAQLNAPTASAAAVPVATTPAPEVTPTMTYAPQAAPAANGPGLPMNIVPVQADAPSPILAAAVGPTSTGGTPLSGTSAQWATSPPAADPHSWFNGGLGPSAQSSPAGTKLYSYSKGKAAPDDWSPPTPVMTPPPVTPLGALAAVPRPGAPAMGGVLMVRR